MNYSDKWETNAEGNQFVFTIEMQRGLAAAGLPIEPASLSSLPAQTSPPPRRERQERQDSTSSSRPPKRQEERRPRREDKDFSEPDSIQIDPMSGKYIGRIKWYNFKKGFGFIMRGAGEEIFFHKSASEGSLGTITDGQWILYDVEETGKGPEATDIEFYDGEGTSE